MKIFVCFGAAVFSLVCWGKEGGKVHELPNDMAAQTISLNPQYCVFGESLASGGEKLPLLIYLHGAGGVGTDVRKAQRQAASVVDAIRRTGIEALIVAPQASKSPKRDGAKGGWVADDLNVLLAHLLTTLAVDPDRVYLTGNSMGGYGTYMWAGSHPEHFAAIAPMVGGLGALGPKDVTKDLAAWGTNLAELPMRAYYGADDPVVPADRGAMIEKAIKAAGGTQAEIIVLKGQSHSAGRLLYGQPDFYKWLFSHKRKQ